MTLYMLKWTLEAGLRALALISTHGCEELGKCLNSLNLSFLVYKIIIITVAFSWGLYEQFTLSTLAQCLAYVRTHQTEARVGRCECERACCMCRLEIASIWLG